MSSIEKFLERVRAFARGPVSDAAPDWSMGKTPKPQLFKTAARLGLTGVMTPVEHGGLGYGFTTLAKACEALAAVDFGFAMSLVNTQNVAFRLSKSASVRVQDTYLPGLLGGKISACTALTEPSAGSDFAAVTTRATQTAEGWKISGEKRWIINGRHAGLAMVFAQCGQAGDASSIAGFLVDLNQPGVRRYPIDTVFSQTSMGTGGFVLEDVAVPADCLLLPPGGAFKSVLIEINAARAYVAAMCNAMLEATILQAADYGAHRESFGAPLGQHQAWRAPLGAAQADLAASRALTAGAVALIEADDDAQLAAAQAKIVAVEAAQRHIPNMLHAMGAAGLSSDFCFSRHLGGAQIAGFTDGATSILRDRVARSTQPRAARRAT